MECWSNERIEGAAVWMADAGIAPGVAPGAAVAPDLVKLLQHARDCEDCRERLHVLFDAEILMRARGRSAVIMPLKVAECPPAADAPDPSLPHPWAEPYPIAAQTPDVVVGVNPESRCTPILTLATGDDRFLVRIFSNTPGPGATAVLYPPQRGATLRIEGTTYRFDGEGAVQLPRFPGANISLVIR